MSDDNTLHDLYTVTCEELEQPINLTCSHESKSYYDGALGYEALVCRKCGTYFDHEGQHPTDEWSLGFLGKQ